jgi:Protein of unknown function (DUF2860)
MKQWYTLIACLLIFASANAQEQPRGWFGTVQLGAGVIGATEDQESPVTGILDDHPRNPRIDGLTGQKDILLVPVPYLNGTIGYRFDELRLSIKTTPETLMGMPGISIEKELEEDRGTVSLTAARQKIEVWENPYLTGTDRSITDQISWHGSLGWEMIMGLPVSISYTARTVDVRNDEAGRLLPELKRDGLDHLLGLSAFVPLTASLIILPELSCEFMDRDGRSESGVSFTAGAGGMIQLDSLMLMTSASYSRGTYDETHPVWNEKRVDETLSVSQMIQKTGALGRDDLALFMLAAWEARFSSIDFYNCRSFVLGTGVEYSF